MDKPAHILFVEDNRMDVELTLDAFHEAKHVNTIHVASNGQDALDYLFGIHQYADRVVREIDGYWLSLNVAPPESEI
jgi:CheY-like chemotaxis protein